MGRFSKDKRDIFYRLAKEKGYRARSAFKLLQIDQAFGLLENVSFAVDLCAAPGGWSQVLAEKLAGGRRSGDAAKIVAVDLQEMADIPGVRQLKLDITDKETPAAIIKEFGGRRPDAVLSDGAPDLTGMDDVDYYVQSQLVVAAMKMAVCLLEKGGFFVTKIFRGKNLGVYIRLAGRYFDDVCIAKPKACRNSSMEAFLLCRGFKGGRAFEFRSEDWVIDGLAFGGFFSCGNDENFDSDRNYCLKGESKILNPVQKPISPIYSEFLERKGRQRLYNYVSTAHNK